VVAVAMLPHVEVTEKTIVPEAATETAADTNADAERSTVEASILLKHASLLRAFAPIATTSTSTAATSTTATTTATTTASTTPVQRFKFYFGAK
jgi:hypothetical protein